MTHSTINDVSASPPRARRLVVPIATALLVLATGSSSARAQSGKTDPVAAEALFKAGRELIKKGDYAAGCPKFDAALALNPSAGTMLNVAKCHEHDGKLATAWEDYHRAQTLNGETKGDARKRELDTIAAQGIKDLEPRLPKLRIVIASPPKGLTVTRDGKELPMATWSEPLPADPGKHEVSAQAPGHKPVLREVTLVEGKTATVEITLEPEAPPPPPPKTGVPVWAWIAGGAGLAAAGASVYFLVDDLAAINALQTACDTSSNGTYCKPGYNYQADNARKNLDFGLFVGLGSAGLLAIGVAVYGIATAPKAPPATTPSDTTARTAPVVIPWITPESSGLSLSGSF